MNLRDGLLVAHVLFGTAGLLLGPAVLLTRGHLRRAATRGYLLAVTGVAASGAVLAATALARLWWLLPIAAGTQASVLFGLLAWRRGRPGWCTACAHLFGGSYVALVTGVLIARTGNPIFWVLPALLAQWPIAVAKRRLEGTAAESRATVAARLA